MRHELLESQVWSGEGTHAEANCTHHSHAFQLILQSLGHHILIDGIQPDGALAVVPPQSEVQDGHLVCRGEQNIIIYV